MGPSTRHGAVSAAPASPADTRAFTILTAPPGIVDQDRYHPMKLTLSPAVSRYGADAKAKLATRRRPVSACGPNGGGTFLTCRHHPVR